MSVIFLITSKINRDFSSKVSDIFITISTPIIKIISFPVNGSIDLIVNFGELATAKKENIKLREELFKLQNYYLTSLAIHQENKELRSALNFVKSKTENYKKPNIYTYCLFSLPPNLKINSSKSINASLALILH